MQINDAVVAVLSQYIRMALKDAKEMGFTERIRNNVQMEDAHMVSFNRAEASLFVSLKAAPEARAYELGSGLHGTFGKKYGIAATERSSVRDAQGRPQLSFWWEREKKWFVGPQLPIGHPGVAPHPALRPAMINNIEYLRAMLRTSIRREVTATIRTNFQQIYKGHP